MRWQISTELFYIRERRAQEEVQESCVGGGGLDPLWGRKIETKGEIL